VGFVFGGTMEFVDGFVCAVPKQNKEVYKELAQQAAVIFKEHGALAVVECWGEDVPEGIHTSFPMAVKKEPSETVVFAWILWPSREARDIGNKKVMEDPRMSMDSVPRPFDGKRMIYGGFQVIVQE